MDTDPDDGLSRGARRLREARLQALNDFSPSSRTTNRPVGGGRIEVNEQAPASQLNSDVDQAAEAKKLQEHLEKKRAAQLSRLQADNSRRQHFFKFVLIVAGAPVLVASGVMIVLLFQGKVTDTIAVAYFASVVLEVIGLAVIIARYLFPNGGSIPGESTGETEAE